MSERLVLDASAMVALLVSPRAAPILAERLRGHLVHVPAHFDAEVLSALGRLHRAGELSAGQAARSLKALGRSPFERHPLAPLLAAAWRRRADTRLVVALYVALAERLAAPLVTLDRGLVAASRRAELLLL